MFAKAFACSSWLEACCSVCLHSIGAFPKVHSRNWFERSVGQADFLRYMHTLRCVLFLASVAKTNNYSVYIENEKVRPNQSPLNC